MTEIEALRAEVSQLREACLKMFTLIAATLPGAPTSAWALKSMKANVAAAQKPGEADLFDELSTSALRALSSLAVKQHPTDEEVLAIYRGLRPGTRH
jgi:hypothetical protein